MKKGEDFTGISVVFFCHDGKGNVLLQKRGANSRDEQGRWDCGGGALEFGDSVIHTLEKEIKEELMADVLNYEFLGYRDVHREKDGKQTHWIALDFKVLIDPKQSGNGEPHKFDEVSWFPLKALPSPMHSQWDKFFEAYKNIL